MIRKNYKLPPTYHLGNPGSGCFLEPPGHPRYLVQSIFTKSGNNAPWKCPQYFLNDTGYDVLEEVDREFKPLPYEHPRVQEWERYVYSYFRNSYSPDGEDRRVGSAKRSGPPEYHLGYLRVRKYYPEAHPKVELEDCGTYGRDGEWWTTLDERPTPENCPGDKGLRRKHPVNITWCQFCGWDKEEK